jgi:uncharacterized membrane protein YgdD (TMEM256/DUF423 family)
VTQTKLQAVEVAVSSDNSGPNCLQNLCGYTMQKFFLSLGAIYGGLAVTIGAFATHALRASLNPQSLQLIETGVRYQMIHALALLCVGILCIQIKDPDLTLTLAGFSFAIGIIGFSGSLYALALVSPSPTWLGFITPLGGLALILGWASLAIAAWKQF